MYTKATGHKITTQEEHPIHHTVHTPSPKLTHHE